MYYPVPSQQHYNNVMYDSGCYNVLRQQSLIAKNHLHTHAHLMDHGLGTLQPCRCGC